MLYCCGSNGEGQLGLGHREDLDQFVPCIDLISPPKLSAGGNHTLFIDHENTAFLTGKVGAFSSTKFEQLPDQWVHCASGWDFYLLADSTRVFFYGNHQLLSSAELLLLHEFDSPIKSIECGMAHAVVVLENRCLYGFGLGRQGQLSHIDRAATFELLSQRGDQVACGRDFTLVVYKSQLTALGKRIKSLDCSAPATAVYAGWTFFGVVRNDEIKWYGNNTFGQLEAPKTLDIAVGSEHGLAFKDSVLIPWGWGEHGNCPAPTPLSKPPKLYAGCATSWYWID